MKREERIRRYLDGELDVVERRALREEASRDPALAARLAEADEIARALADYEASLDPAPPPDLVARATEAAVAAHGESRVGPLGLLRGKVLQLRVTPVTVLLPAAAAALLWLGGAHWGASRAPTVDAAEVTLEEAGAELAQVGAEATVVVRFVLPAEDATSVSVAGDFNDWSTEGLTLHDADGDGVFVGTAELPRGSYTYMYVLDGERWVTDPYAESYRDDGFGGRNAVLRID